MIKSLFRLRAFLLSVYLVSSAIEAAPMSQRSIVSSPDQRLQLEFTLREGGVPAYRVRVDNKTVIDWSALGYDLKDAESLAQNFKLESTSVSEFDQTWEQVWGEERFIRNHYNQLKVELEQTTPGARKLNFMFRVYNDGVGIRYEVPMQAGLREFAIMNERTEFNFVADHAAWWIDAFKNSDYEQTYVKTAMSQMPSVFTPLTIEAGDLYFSIHEANLTDYAGMYLANTGGGRVKAELYPWSDGILVKTQAPMVSPWRTIQIGRSPGDLVTSYLILNLNEPNRLTDTSWIRPSKFMGVWWGMHIGRYTWGSGPDHGATTAIAERYIRAAQAFGIPGLLVEGWNVGWDGDWIKNGNLFSFTEPYHDFNLPYLAAFAKDHGIELIGHHETAGGISNYERQMEDAYKLYQRLGIHKVKTGYVSDRMEGRQWRHSQYMVRHHQRVTEMAAKYQIALDIHEPIKDTGHRRTYPNIMTREGAKGNEYDAWGGENHNPPSHHTILPFTRSLSGPFDYTPGIFDLYKGKTVNDRIRTTIVKQLALFVTIYSPLQMVADLPENYIGHPLFKFIHDVPTDWETTRVLNGVIGEYATIVRKDRNSSDWYLGSVSNELARVFSVKLDFLDPEHTYLAEIYSDAPTSHYLNQPLTFAIKSKIVRNKDSLNISLAPGGGSAIRFIKQ